MIVFDFFGVFIRPIIRRLLLWQLMKLANILVGECRGIEKLMWIIHTIIAIVHIAFIYCFKLLRRDLTIKRHLQ